MVDSRILQEEIDSFMMAIGAGVANCNIVTGRRVNPCILQEEANHFMMAVLAG